ncbi:MAG: tetratricopeptide repeat protein [Spirochaetaceae bacterium]|jgi:outer membrane protein assembly factor BamD (BamD/ComL family)|nr:tetratricopeptide repeat protein [Spirochaetaceae bacterium]
MKKQLLAVAGAAFLAAVLLSCYSGPVKLADDVTAAELVQQGQAAYEWNRYAQAVQYYEAVLERFPGDIDRACESEYEIARIHYKQKKYTQARVEMEALRARYDTGEGEILPTKFKILSEIVLGQIADKQKQIIAEE